LWPPFYQITILNTQLVKIYTRVKGAMQD
jgi:hypothetical protein